ncbi:MAG: cyclase family protein [Chloroflexota bacterium]
MEWFDISVPITPGMVTFEGDPSVSLERTESMADGAICNVSQLSFGVHSGTHVDAPVHFIPNAAGIEAVPLEALVGPAEVVAMDEPRGQIDAAAVARLTLPADATRVLFKVNSHLWDEAGFQRGFVAVTADGAEALIRRGVRLVGIDYLSIAPFGDPTPTHRALLEAGVVILEGLDLRRVSPGSYELICLPLLIAGSDAGPARAVLRRGAPEIRGTVR